MNRVVDTPHFVHIPHFVGEIQFCVKFFQREYMNTGLIQGKAVADMIQFIVRKKVAMRGDLKAWSEMHVYSSIGVHTFLVAGIATPPTLTLFLPLPLLALSSSSTTSAYLH